MASGMNLTPTTGSMKRTSATWLFWLALARAPLILAAGVVVVGLIMRETVRIALTQRMAWWLPTLIIGTALAGAAVGFLTLTRELVTREDDKSFRPLVWMSLLVMMGFLVAFWFGWTVPDGDIMLSLILVGAMSAAMAVGSLVGFLFGLPRFDFGARRLAAAVASGTSNVPANGGGSTGTNGVPALDYRPSTNLDEIADWLSKIIVGLGLTQLTMAGTHLTGIAKWMLAPYSSAIRTHQGFLAAMIVVGAVGGFIFGYVWTRLNYAELAAGADVRTINVMRTLELKSVGEAGIGKGSTGATSALTVPQLGDAAIAASVDVALSDPNKGRFGKEPVRNGRRLSAQVDASELGAGLYRVTLMVASTEKLDPLDGYVTFHLHPTFRNHIVNRRVIGGVAKLTVVSYGAFTVGAEADNGRTRLELDLAQLDVPDDFKSR